MAAPTIVKFEQYPGSQLPKLSYFMGFGYSLTRLVTSTFQWNASGSGTNEYYLSLSGGGDPTATLTSNSILNPKFRFEDNGVAADNDMIAAERGTAGSLAAYEFDYADNDSLGYSTWYVRLPSGSAPVNETSVLIWDESTTGDGSDIQDNTFEWRCTSYPEGWSDKYRTYYDHKWGATLDWAEETWSSTKTSRIRGTVMGVVLDAVGDYTFEGRQTNAAKDQTTVEFSITVASETRTGVTVYSGGGEDYTSIQAALAAGENLITVLGDHSETNTTSATGVNISSSTITGPLSIEWDGNGAVPQVANSVGSRIYFMQFLDGVHIYGLEGVASGTTNINGEMFRIGAVTNVSLVNVFMKPGATPATDLVGHFVKNHPASSTFLTSGLLIQNCGEDGDAYDDYWMTPNSYARPIENTVILGCYIPGSPTEHSLRFNALHPNTTICGCDIKVTQGDSIRIGDNDAITVYGNKIAGGIRLGDFVARPIRTRRVRIEANIMDRDATTSGLGNISVGANTSDVTIVNNIGDVGVDVPGIGSGATNPATSVTASNPYLGYAGINNIKVANNTAIMRAGNKDAFHGATGTYVDTASFIAGNIVQDDPLGSWTGIAYDEGDWTLGSNDAAADYELDADYIPTGATTEALRDEVYDDLWNNVRASITVRGAVESQSTPMVVNRTPASGGTDITTAATISLQFDQNMAVDNASATIELRLVSNDSTVDSITAGDATINISDRTQVTLTGLSTVGATGSVYVYIPADAFKSAVTGVSYEGDLTSTDWSFTMLSSVTPVSAPARGRARRRSR